MSTFEITPEVEEKIREIVRDELQKAEVTHRPPWDFGRMDAAMRRVEEQRKPTATPKEPVEPATE
jgi:hypothetical protein